MLFPRISLVYHQRIHPLQNQRCRRTIHRNLKGLQQIPWRRSQLRSKNRTHPRNRISHWKRCQCILIPRIQIHRYLLCRHGLRYLFLRWIIFGTILDYSRFLIRMWNFHPLRIHRYESRRLLQLQMCLQSHHRYGRSLLCRLQSRNRHGIKFYI